MWHTVRITHTLKRCSSCRILKELIQFTRNQANRDGLNHNCRSCHRKYTSKHYRENKASYRARTKANAKQALAWLRSLKCKPCYDCKRKYPYYVMDFDHVRGTKSFNLARSAVRYGKRRVLAEVAKCDLVCANCHRTRTHQRRTGNPSK